MVEKPGPERGAHVKNDVNVQSLRQDTTEGCGFTAEMENGSKHTQNTKSRRRRTHKVITFKMYSHFYFWSYIDSASYI